MEGYHTFRGKILGKCCRPSIIDISVPSILMMRAILIRLDNKDVPMYIIIQNLIEGYLEETKKNYILLHLVDEKDRPICSD